MNELFEKLEEKYLEKGEALLLALTLIQWDGATLAPIEGEGNTAKMVGVLSDLYFNAYINDEVKAWMSELETQKAELNKKEQAVLKELSYLYDQMESIPPAEYREFAELKANAINIWSRAKEQGDFKAFAPTLEKIIGYAKKFVTYRYKEAEQKNAYDILLGDYEPGFNEEKLDEFFTLIKEELVPFIKETVEKTKDVNKSFIYKSYDIEKQKEFSKYLAEYVGFDFNKGVMAESAHPFTSNLHNTDVRITNHYYENNLESAIFSVIHESGHALYEMQVDDELTLSLVGTGASMGLHESQSRFFENIIGRSEPFWMPLFPKLKETFPEQLKDVKLVDFIRAINKPVCSKIRTEADELTYSLHILIRYEIEKMIFHNEIEVEDMKRVWNEKYQEYLGVEPSNDAEGVLQDVHWSGGDFGYFPTYALGSAIAAQIYYHMKKVMPFNQYLEEERLEPIQEFLKVHIHRFGKMKNTDEILKDMMGETFNPKYFIQYLKEKYEALYSK